MIAESLSLQSFLSTLPGISDRLMLFLPKDRGDLGPTHAA